MPQYLLVGNPTARSGKAQGRIDAALAGLAKRGVSVEFSATEPEGRTVDVVRDALQARPCDVVVALGGDGTFAEVAKGILASGGGATLGLIPSGTANNMAKSLGLSHHTGDLDEILDVVLSGHVVELDAAHIEQLEDAAVVRRDTFFDCAGWGLMSAMLQRRNRDRDMIQEIPLLRDVYRDQMVYIGAGVTEFLKSFVDDGKFDVALVADGVETIYHGVTDVLINNTAVYAGSWVPEPDARPDDGLVEIVPFVGRRDMFTKFVRDFKDMPVWRDGIEAMGIHPTPAVAAAEIDLRLLRRGAEAVACQIDGEEWGTGRHYRVSVAKNALRVATPAGWVPPWRTDSK